MALDHSRFGLETNSSQTKKNRPPSQPLLRLIYWTAPKFNFMLNQGWLQDSMVLGGCQFTRFNFWVAFLYPKREAKNKKPSPNLVAYKLAFYTFQLLITSEVNSSMRRCFLNYTDLGQNTVFQFFQFCKTNCTHSIFRTIEDVLPLYNKLKDWPHQYKTFSWGEIP